jgi:hypothetical protein
MHVEPTPGVPDTTGAVTFVERRGAGNVVAGLLTVAFVGAAARGATWSPIATVLAGAAAAVVVVIWVIWHRKPAAHLHVARNAISYTRSDRAISSWPYAPDARLRLRRNRSGAYLSLVDGDRAAINLMGFDLRAVAKACIDNGWTFDR